MVVALRAGLTGLLSLVLVPAAEGFYIPGKIQLLHDTL
jgi:hypothetical protein